MRLKLTGAIGLKEAVGSCPRGHGTYVGEVRHVQDLLDQTAPSPPRNCPHETLPFVEAPAKAKLAGSIEAQPGDHLAALSAFRIVDIPIMAARNKDVRRKRIMLGFHRHKFGFNITYRRS